MKLLFTIFLSIFLTKGCSEYKDLEKVKMVYEANTRGYHKKISIENKTFYVTNERGGKPTEIKLSDQEWKQIADLFRKINLSTFNDLEGATQERHRDAKAFANLIITKEDIVYTTKGFDHTIPPIEIKELVDTIIKLSEKK
jgi:aspartate/tyrosine/aromatic aminotransferase